MEYSKGLLSLSPVLMNRNRSVEQVLQSELLSLAYSSDVNDPDAGQFELAQHALKLRSALLSQGVDPAVASEEEACTEFLSTCESIVRAHLVARREYFGNSQCEPLPDIDQMVDEGRDTFLIIKFMDEAPHIRATLQSLINQQNIDHKRLVIVAADNMSRDGSDKIVLDLVESNLTDIRIIYIKQPTPGGGSAARYGVDRSLATILKMCEVDGDYARLQRARIAVSDGDTVYHPNLVSESAKILDEHPEIDGVMPFLLYKITACHRFFNQYIPRNPNELAAAVPDSALEYVLFPHSLTTQDALARFPRADRNLREKDGYKGMELTCVNSEPLGSIFVPFISSLQPGLRFGIMQDPSGAKAYVFEDRTITLEAAPVSGDETALLSLENNCISGDEKWKWHALVGHDLFLTWSFQRMGLSEELILPDTSDALKVFRAWSFAVGGQHQLSRPNMQRVTGTDYQSGRVIQAFGGQTVLGPSSSYTETEVDRLAKMIRNFANEQSVFYGNTRSRGLERASGLYLHMTSIQAQVEAEIRSYTDNFYENVAFPERVIFPFRWMLQNFIGYYARANANDRAVIARKSFSVIFDDAEWSTIRLMLLTEKELADLCELPFEKYRERSEELAEEILKAHWPSMMRFYSRTLTSYFDHHKVSAVAYGWLLEGLDHCRNSLLESRLEIDPNDVWSSPEFVIDHERGQVTNMKEVAAD